MANPGGKGGFKKGQSGNPGGRTAEEVAAAKAINSVLRGEDFQDAAKTAYLRLLREANPVIVKDYMDRVGGKAVDRVEVTTETDGTLSIVSAASTERIVKLLKGEG